MSFHSYMIGWTLALVGVLFAILVWRSLPVDPVGRAPRMRREEGGLQGRVAQWLGWDASLSTPRLRLLEEGVSNPPEDVGGRALWAVVGRVQVERQLSRRKAHELLVKEARSPETRAFLQGKMRRAVRLHWRSRYHGPEFLFIPWYYLVAVVRYGHRHLYLETLSVVLQELRRA